MANDNTSKSGWVAEDLQAADLYDPDGDLGEGTPNRVLTASLQGTDVLICPTGGEIPQNLGLVVYTCPDLSAVGKCIFDSRDDEADVPVLVFESDAHLRLFCGHKSSFGATAALITDVVNGRYDVGFEQITWDLPRVSVNTLIGALSTSEALDAQSRRSERASAQPRDYQRKEKPQSAPAATPLSESGPGSFLVGAPEA